MTTKQSGQRRNIKAFSDVVTSSFYRFTAGTGSTWKVDKPVNTALTVLHRRRMEEIQKCSE